jgi:hypothetical protein
LTSGEARGRLARLAEAARGLRDAIDTRLKVGEVSLAYPGAVADGGAKLLGCLLRRLERRGEVSLHLGRQAGEVLRGLRDGLGNPLGGLGKLPDRLHFLLVDELEILADADLERSLQLLQRRQDVVELTTRAASGTGDGALNLPRELRDVLGAGV